MQSTATELQALQAQAEALVGQKANLRAGDVEGGAALEAQLAEVIMAEGALAAKLARHNSTGLPRWRASMAEACRTIGMDGVGFALEAGLDPTTLAWPRFVPVIRLCCSRLRVTPLAAPDLGSRGSSGRA